ncbi:RNA N6-adenosine-methyltransferase mettl16-like [Sycon ciliatum]|uniref:RNA N6-adenosine-methyltransferase mettl16-like n=1 Tax=Sycon ciliatum TaxID=27933 RepID=UPI0031F620F8
MHPRSRYCNARPEFTQLASKHAGFNAASHGGKRINFKSEQFQRELTRALLEVDFGLQVELPHDRLVPAVPQRLNYLHWVEDLVTGGDDAAGHIPRGSTVRGVDIGTGASAIFSLLASKLNGWSMVATEVDSTSIDYALANVKRNDMEQSIDVVRVSPDEFLLAPLSRTCFPGDVQFLFCMCNPPFFSSEKEASGCNSRPNRPQPSATCTGAGTEMVVDGGEVHFVGRILQDSLVLKDRIRWYTSMLGKKSSVAALKRTLTDSQVPCVETTEFVQGKTRRWGIAWSFCNDIAAHAAPCLASTSSSGQATGKSRKRKRPLQCVIPAATAAALPQCNPVAVAGDALAWAECRVEQVLRGLEIVFSCTSSGGTRCYACSAATVTWTHGRRKRREAVLQAQRQQEAAHEAAAAARAASSAQVRNATDTSKSTHSDSADALRSHSPPAAVHGAGTSSPSDHLSTRPDTQEEPLSHYRTLSQRDHSEDPTAAPSKASTNHADCRSGASALPVLEFSIVLSPAEEEDKGTTMEVDCDANYNRELLHQVFLYLKNQLQVGERQ